MTELEKWEVSLLMEQRVLMVLGHTWKIFCEVTSKEMDENRGYLDEQLVECVLQILQSVRGLLYYGAELTVNGKEIDVPSIVAQLKDVNDEILALQAGKPTKEKGGPHVDPGETGASGPDAPPPTGNQGPGRKPRNR